MKTVYISMPITGQEETAWSRFQTAVDYIHSKKGYEDCNIVGPLTIEEFRDAEDPKSVGSDKTYGYFMGESVRRLIDGPTDILMCPDWLTSRGCQIEHQTAKIMGINRIYMRPADMVKIG